MRVALIVADDRDEFGNYELPAPQFNPAPTALLDGFRELGEHEFHIISCAKRPMVTPEKLAQNIFFHSLIVPQSGWFRTGYSGCVRAVRRCLQQLNPDVVHGQGTERYCGLASTFAGKPNVLTIHGNMIHMVRYGRGKQWMFYKGTAWLENLALARSQGVFCNSAFTEQAVAGRTARTWRVPNAIEAKFFEPLPARTSLARPILLNVGVIAPHKRQYDILKMAGNLHSRGLKFEMQFAGALPATPYGAQFSRELEKARASGYAQYLGLRARSEIVALFDGASALIHCPSEESFGLVVAEALARNAKFFGFRVGGVSDVAKDIDGAVTTQDGRWQELEEAIASWLRAGAPQPQIAHQQIRDRYHPRTVAGRHLEIYREVVR